MLSFPSLKSIPAYVSPGPSSYRTVVYGKQASNNSESSDTRSRKPPRTSRQQTCTARATAHHDVITVTTLPRAGIIRPYTFCASEIANSTTKTADVCYAPIKEQIKLLEMMEATVFPSAIGHPREVLLSTK